MQISDHGLFVSSHSLFFKRWWCSCRTLSNHFLSDSSGAFLAPFSVNTVFPCLVLQGIDVGIKKSNLLHICLNLFLRGSVKSTPRVCFSSGFRGSGRSFVLRHCLPGPIRWVCSSNNLVKFVGFHYNIFFSFIACSRSIKHVS